MMMQQQVATFDPSATETPNISSVRFESAIEKQKRHHREAQQQQQQQQQVEVEAAGTVPTCSRDNPQNNPFANLTNFPIAADDTKSVEEERSTSVSSELPEAPKTTQQQWSSSSTYDVLAHDKVYIQAMEAAEYAEELLTEQAEAKRLREREEKVHWANALFERWDARVRFDLARSKSTVPTSDTTIPSITTTPNQQPTPAVPTFSTQDLAMAFEGASPPPQETVVVSAQEAAPSWSRDQEAAPSWCRDLQQQQQHRQSQHPPRTTTVDYGLECSQRHAEYAPKANNKTTSAVLGASVVGGVAGLVMAGPVVGLVGAAGLAYSAATKEGVVANTLRATGSATASVVAVAASAVNTVKNNHNK